MLVRLLHYFIIILELMHACQKLAIFSVRVLYITKSMLYKERECVCYIQLIRAHLKYKVYHNHK